MSHVSAYQTTVVFAHVGAGGELADDPAWGILQDAVRACAEARGGDVGASVGDAFGRVQACDLSLSLPALRQGVGLKVDRQTGELSFLYDAYGLPRAAIATLTDEILQNFASIAVARALRELRYEVDLDERGEGEQRRVVVRGVL